MDDEEFEPLVGRGDAGVNASVNATSDERGRCSGRRARLETSDGSRSTLASRHVAFDARMPRMRQSRELTASTAAGGCGATGGGRTSARSTSCPAWRRSATPSAGSARCTSPAFDDVNVGDRPAGRSGCCDHKFLAAAYLIFLAMVFDALDGRLARFTRHTTDFGGQLDSLADVVSFGAAPAFIALHAVQGRGPADVPVRRLAARSGPSARSTSAAPRSAWRGSTSATSTASSTTSASSACPAPARPARSSALILMQQDLRDAGRSSGSATLRAARPTSCVYAAARLIVLVHRPADGQQHPLPARGQPLPARPPVDRAAADRASCCCCCWSSAHRYMLGIGMLVVRAVRLRQLGLSRLRPPDAAGIPVAVRTAPCHRCAGTSRLPPSPAAVRIIRRPMPDRSSPASPRRPPATSTSAAPRTALFSWLLARHHGGRFLLRIEDTDLARSTEQATHAAARRPPLARPALGQRRAGLPVEAAATSTTRSSTT